MRTARWRASLVLCSLMLGLASGGAGAQEPEPLGPPECYMGPSKGNSLAAGEAGDHLITSDRWWSADISGSGLVPQDTDGPDDFGYTWDDSVSLDWIDASGGTDTGIDTDTDHVGPVHLGFSFKYYENIYTQLYISRFGFVAFNDDGIYDGQSEIPNPSLPNDVIAPHWVPAYDVNGYVRYLRGGTAPNRWLVIEWNRVESDCCTGDSAEEYTFEVILHESGDIVFQYATMTVDGGYYCQASGIEDSIGLDGLSITDFCEQIAPNHAVRVYRPAPSARVQLRPAYHGQFAKGGDTVVFRQRVRNTGDLGSDTYDLFVSSPWPMELYGSDGVSPLGDTDRDGTVDTGTIDQGNETYVTVKVAIPPHAEVGDASKAEVTVRSSLSTSKSEIATFQMGIPAPFAQAFCDHADGAMSLDLVRPTAELAKKVTADGYYGSYPAVAEGPDGNLVYAWTKWRSDSAYVREIEYALVTPCGTVSRPPSRLTDHSGATINTYNYDPAVAVAPDGRTGVVWYRRLYNSSDSTWNYNIYYAILEPSGEISVSEENLTNNPLWGYG